MDLFKLRVKQDRQEGLKVEAEILQSRDNDALNLQAMKDYVTHPFVTLHTSCSGFGARDIALRVVLMDSSGKALLSSLIRPPKNKPIPSEWLQGLSCSKEELRAAPEYQTVRKQLKTFCKGKKVICCSRNILRVLNRTADRTGGNQLGMKIDDIQHLEFNAQLITQYDVDGNAMLTPMSETEAIAICEWLRTRANALVTSLS